MVCRICESVFARPKPTGRRPIYCSEKCRREGACRRTKAWVEANESRHKERGRSYREKNADRIAETKAAWAKKTREQIYARQKRWRATRPAKPRTPEQRAEAVRRVRAWADANPEKRAAQRAAYRKAHPEQINAKVQRRRARRLSVPADQVCITELLDEQFDICGLCGMPIDRVLRFPDPFSPSIDHIVPLARGGTGLRENLQATHLRCNVRKGARLAS